MLWKFKFKGELVAGEITQGRIHKKGRTQLRSQSIDRFRHRTARSQKEGIMHPGLSRTRSRRT